MTPLLSFENAPPWSVPARFFVGAPWHGVLAGLVLLVAGEEALASRWSAPALALTHLLTVGFLLQVMIGALFQFLPVAADAGITRPRLVAGIVHPALNLGALALAAAFWWSSPPLFGLAAGLLALAVGLFAALALAALLPKRPTSPTLPALKLALGGLLVTLALGLGLIAAVGFGVVADTPRWTAIHAAWGLIGWSALLVIGVAYVVVPMFQLTPGYGKKLGWRLPPTVLGLVVAYSLALLAGIDAVAALPAFALAAALGVFAATTLGLQGQSHRPDPDTTYFYWRLAMLCTLLATGLWAGLPGLDFAFGRHAAPPSATLALGVLAVFGGLVSVIGGMLYKIVPFLCWLDLQRLGFERGVSKTPHMGAFLREARMRPQLFAHIATLALLLVAVALPPLAPLAGLAMIASFGGLGVNLASALAVAARERRKLPPPVLP